MKFKMNIKELSFEFEGDVDQGQKIQGGISKALGDIGALQNEALGLPSAKTADAKIIEAPALVRTRRRRRRVETSDTQGDESQVDHDEAGGNAPKSTGSSPTELLIGLRKGGFFEGGKTVGDIVSHVNAKGHTKLTSASFSAQLQSLTKRDVLVRTQEDGTWKYSPGTKDE